MIDGLARSNISACAVGCGGTSLALFVSASIVALVGVFVFFTGLRIVRSGNERELQVAVKILGFGLESKSLGGVFIGAALLLLAASIAILVVGLARDVGLSIPLLGLEGDGSVAEAEAGAEPADVVTERVTEVVTEIVTETVTEFVTEVENPSSQPDSTDGPTQELIADYEVPLSEFAYYDLDDRTANSEQTSSTDIQLGVVNPLGRSASIDFAGTGRVIEGSNMSPSTCESSSILRDGRANIYGPGDGPVVCIETSEGNTAILRHLPGNVEGPGIVIGVQLYSGSSL